MSNFFKDVDGAKDATRGVLRAAIYAAINKPHYYQSVSHNVATTLLQQDGRSPLNRERLGHKWMCYDK